MDHTFKTPDTCVNRANVVRADSLITSVHDWGRIVFFASHLVGEAPEHSMGRCEILPGKELPRHYHPNCSEIIHVESGSISHTVDGDQLQHLHKGDTVVVPRGFAHQAINIGPETAVLLISFSSPRREVVLLD
jgi:quercetin dioxygenase-like cupin family protein